VSSVLCDTSPVTSDERWQISGSAPEKYECFVASWFRPWAEDLIERSGVKPGDHVIDVACGTGIVTRAAAPVVGPDGSIVATDLNEDMLAEARRHDVTGAPVIWRQADATELPFLSEIFDAVLCQQGLQFVPDKAAAVAEMRRVLRPDGVAAVSVWRSAEHNPYIAALADGLTRHVSVAAGQSMLAPCGFGDRDELAALFEDSGYASVEVDVVTITRDPVDAAAAIAGNLAALPVAAEIGALSPAEHDRMVEHIIGLLGAEINDGRLTSTNSSHVVVARP
jgi:ubiquinone/menaquinone biosynthesis C-methylase UbiE